MSTLVTTTTSAGARRAPSRSAVLLVCCLAQLMVVLDVSVVMVALPQARHDLHMSASAQQWVVNAYTLTFAGFLMLGGRAADLWGRKRVFLLGLGAFTLFSLLGGLATSASWLVLARAAQGLGGAILAPATLSLLTTTFPQPEERRRALGAWSATAASGAAVGVLAGGILTQALDWRWVLFINVPIGAGLIALTALRVHEQPAARSASSLDVPGALTVTAGLALAVYGIVNAGDSSWAAAGTIVPLVAGALLLVGFALVEKYWAAQPLVPLAVFRLRSVSASNSVAVFIGAAVFGLYFFLSLYLQQVNGYSALEGGLAYLPAGLATLLAALTGSRLVAVIGVRRQLLVGPLLAAGGLGWLATLQPGMGYLAHVFGPLVLAGIGFGLSFVPMTMAATTGMPREQAGLAAGLINTTRQVGGALGLAAMSTVVADMAGGSAHRAPAQVATALTNGYDAAFLLCCAALVAAAVAARLLPHQGRARTSEPGEVDLRAGRAEALVGAGH